VLEVIARIGPEVGRIYCVDDACPEGSFAVIEAHCRDPRVRALRHDRNMGVGGAMRTGYAAALADGCGIVVKIDGDGQMDPALLPYLVGPILRREADYAKGNRFFSVEDLRAMPAARLFGNAVLSFVTKLSSGYWSVFDPTNGYTAIHAAVLARLPLEKLANRYFFESDLLFRLNILRAVVRDVPMAASYGVERSNLMIRRVVLPFLAGHARNLLKRIGYNYFLRDFQVASLELVLGLLALGFGVTVGLVLWVTNSRHGLNTPAGPVMLAALPILVGINMLLSFLNFDIRSEPTHPIHLDLPSDRDAARAGQNARPPMPITMQDEAAHQ
jgi:glycosyltransferase involved in cell wall biosynthesis